MIEPWPPVASPAWKLSLHISARFVILFPGRQEPERAAQLFASTPVIFLASSCSLSPCIYVSFPLFSPSHALSSLSLSLILYLSIFCLSRMLSFLSLSFSSLSLFPSLFFLYPSLFSIISVSLSLITTLSLSDSLLTLPPLLCPSCGGAPKSRALAAHPASHSKARCPWRCPSPRPQPQPGLQSGACSAN